MDSVLSRTKIRTNYNTHCVNSELKHSSMTNDVMHKLNKRERSCKITKPMLASLKSELLRIKA